jgi:multidrug transporter EmrE-like cation transporter
MFGSGVSESKHRKQQPSASTSGGLLEVEAIADGDTPRGGGGSMSSSPHVSGANGTLLRSPSASKDRRDHALLAAFFLAILAVENTASMLARRYAVGVLKLQFSKNAVLAVNELMKMAFSVAMEAKRIREGSRDGVSPRRHPILGRGNSGGLRAHLRRVARHSPRMAVPALVYLVVNLISYPALERINASVFTAISQLKVLATAFFAVVMLGTPVSLRKWRTLTVMVLGVTLVSWQSAPAATSGNSGDAARTGVSPDYLFGVACAGVQTMLSGFGSIYFELVLKRGVDPRLDAANTSASTHEREKFSVWDRNVQLALWSSGDLPPGGVARDGRGVVARLDAAGVVNRDATRERRRISRALRAVQLVRHENRRRVRQPGAHHRAGQRVFRSAARRAHRARLRGRHPVRVRVQGRLRGGGDTREAARGQARVKADGEGPVVKSSSAAKSEARFIAKVEGNKQYF